MPVMFKTAAAFMFGLPLIGQAGLVGSSVTGSLLFTGDTNYFDPANSDIPAGFGNVDSTTVTVGDPLVEFGYEDSFSRITADFTSTRLTITELPTDSGEATVVRFTFFDDEFINRVAVPVSNTFTTTPVVSLSEDRLDVRLPMGYLVTSGTATAFTLALTLPGDADLNGTVDFNDFLILQNNFGHPNTAFTQGNFNFDGQTDFNDFLALQNNFGNSVTGSTSTATAAEFAAMTTFAATVPEPAGLAAIGIAAAGLLRRRRDDREV